MQPKHSPFSPSGAHQWINCPASIRLTAELNLPEPPASLEAMEGTNAHSQAAFALEKRLASIGDPAIDLYLDTVYGMLDKLPNSELFIEKKVRILVDCWGTLDAAVYSSDKKELHIFDYKHGKGIFVEIENNPQLKLYWYGMAKQLNVEHGSMTIVQPRHWSNEPPVRQEYLKFAEVRRWIIDEVGPAMESVKTAEATPGDWCRWCPAMVGCPTIKDMLFTGAATAREKTVEALSATEAEKMYQGLIFLEQYKKSLEALIAQKLTTENGDFTARFKFVKTRRRRVWADEEGVKPFIELLGLDPEKLYQKKLVSPRKPRRFSRMLT